MPAAPTVPPPAARTAVVYYGWIITAVCFVMAFFAWGVAFYGHGFFIAALRAEHGWSTAALSTAVAAFWFVAVPGALVIGRLLDRFGPRWVVLYGAVAMGGGAMLLGQATALWQVFVLFMLMGSAYPALATAAVSAALVPWFERRLGLALGLALTGASAGGMLMPPVMVWLTQVQGFDIALGSIGATLMVLVLPLALFVMRRPMGPSETVGERDQPAPQADTGSGPGVMSFLGALAFWKIAVASALSLAGQVGFLMHQLPALEGPLGLTEAAFAVSLSAGSAVIGRFALGALSIRLPLAPLAAGCYLIQAVGLYLVLLGQGPAMLYGGSALAGLVVGCIVMLPPLLLSQAFGARGYGTAYGLVTAVMFLTASAATTLVGLLRDYFDNYTVAFLMLVGMLMAAAVVITWPRARR